MPVSLGLLTIELHLPEAQTLKDKRQVLQSLLDRLGARFNLSVAETDGNDLHQRAEIALACVSNSTEHCHEVLDKALAMVESEPRAEIVRVEREVN
jgi:uncharacterized protein YlxP (DUF503 family)